MVTSARRCHANAKVQADEQYGYDVYAFFRKVETCYTRRVYRFNGFWAVGSSADRLKIS